MATTLVLPQEYLNTGYNPDREYVDGVLVERPMPTVKHGIVEATTAKYLGNRQREWNIRVATNTRVMVTPTRYRVPDIVVLERPVAEGPAVTQAPAIVIEILSPDDTVEDLMVRCREYEALGTENIIVLDPELKCLYLFGAGSLIMARDASVTVTLPKGRLPVSLPIEVLFEDLDQTE